MPGWVISLDNSRCFGKQWIDELKGKFDRGWKVIRELKWRRRMKRHTSVPLLLTTMLLLLNTAVAQEIIKDKPTPSRAEWAPLGQAYGKDYSTSDVTKVVVLGSGTPAADTRHGGISVAVVVND